jgi:hypothetical protein
MFWSRAAAETDETSETASCRRSDSVLTSELAALDTPLTARSRLTGIRRGTRLRAPTLS